MDALASRAVLHTMRYKTATLAVLTLLAVMAGGASAASMTQPPASSAADVEQPENYTVETIDPDDQLTRAEAELARQLAWGNDTVREHVDADDPINFQPQAPASENGHVSVWIEQNGTAQATADIDLDTESVVAAGDVHVLTVDETDSIDVETTLEASGDADATVFEVTTDRDGNGDIALEGGNDE